MPGSSRREFLSLMLGAAAAQTACRSPFRHVAGTIRGASVDLGHRLRTVQQLGAPTRTVSIPIVIVGAGPSGLAAGWRLMRLGEDRFTILELEGQAGGTSCFGTDAVVPYPWGAHYVPVPRQENRAFVTLLSELGAIEGEDENGEIIPSEPMVVREPEERVFFGDGWYDGLYLQEGATSRDRAELLSFRREIDRYVGLRDGQGRRAFDIPIERGSDDPSITALDQISMASWLSQKGIFSPRLRWLVDYACRDDYGLCVEDTSAWAGIFYFASRMRLPGAEAANLLAWPQGNGRLVEHFLSVLGARVQLQALVVDIAVFNDQHVEVLVLQEQGQQLVRYRCERVIFAVPKFLAPYLIRTVRDEKPAWCHAFSYGAWMVANLHLSAHPLSRGAPLAWDNVLYDSPSLGYVVATHQAHIDRGPTVLTYYYPYTDKEPSAGRKRLWAGEHSTFADMILADLRPAHHNLDHVLDRLDVWRWGHAMAQPRVGFLWGPERRLAALPIAERIHMAHSDLSGLALFEEALHHGVRAAEEVYTARHPMETLTRLG